MGEFAVFGQDLFAGNAAYSFALTNESNGKRSIF